MGHSSPCKQREAVMTKTDILTTMSAAFISSIIYISRKEREILKWVAALKAAVWNLVGYPVRC